jgi:hypothetical protein
VGVACARHFREAAVLVLGDGLPGRRRLAWGSPVAPPLPALDDDIETKVLVLLLTLMLVAATNSLRRVS